MSTFKNPILFHNPFGLRVCRPLLTTSTSFWHAAINVTDNQYIKNLKYKITFLSILPVNDSNLIANQQGGTTKLNQYAAGKHNLIHYKPEYSISNTNFTSWASANRCTSANGIKQYTYILLPAVLNGTIFYSVVQHLTNSSKSITNQSPLKLNDKNAPSILVMSTLIADVANLRILTSTSGKTVINVVNKNGRLIMKKEFSLTAGNTILNIDGWASLANNTNYVQANKLDLKKVIVQH